MTTAARDRRLRGGRGGGPAACDLPGVELQLGRVHARRGDLVTAASHLDAAVESLAGAGDWPSGVLPRALVERALVAQRAGDPAAAAADADAGAGDRRRRGQRATWPRRRTGSSGSRPGIAAISTRPRSSWSRASCSRPTTRTAARRSRPATPWRSIRAAAGDRAGAIALLEDALAASRRTGERHLEAAIENNLADQLHASGRTEEAMDHLKRAVTLFAEVGGRPGELEPEIWKLVTW